MPAEEVQETPSQEQESTPKEASPEESTPEEATPKEASPEEEKLIKEFPSEKKAPPIKKVLIVLVIIIAGIATGYLFSTRSVKIRDLRSTESISETGLKVGEVFGNPDVETFRDEVEGVLVKGGIDGEGSHRLLRPGGESQNVYLTSSVVDLEQFADHKIRIWGETFTAQKAGWLMDVGRVEVLELNAEKPFEE